MKEVTEVRENSVIKNGVYHHDMLHLLTNQITTYEKRNLLYNKNKLHKKIIMEVIKIIMWIIIFSHTALTVMAIRWAIDEHKNNKRVKSLYHIEIEHYELNM